MTQQPANSLRITTPTETTIVLLRDFNAPRRLVWEAMTEPAKMRRWMLAPPGWTLTLCECQARIGGVLSLAWKSAEADPVMTLKGVFTDVAPLDRMVHTETMALGNGQAIGSLVEKHEFEERAGTTTMRITQEYASKADRDGALASGMDQGMEAGYKQLDELLVRGD